MRVGEQECEEREFGYLVAGRIGRHHAAGTPEVEFAHREALDGCAPRSLPKLYRSVEISKHDYECRSKQTRDNRRYGSHELAPVFRGGRQVVNYRVREGGGHGEEERHSEVQGYLGCDSGDVYQHPHEELAPIVVVDVPAPEPGVVGRHIAGFENGVQVGHVHWLLPAPIRVPEVGIGHSDQDERGKRGHKYQFGDKDCLPALL